MELIWFALFLGFLVFVELVEFVSVLMFSGFAGDM